MNLNTFRRNGKLMNLCDFFEKLIKPTCRLFSSSHHLQFQFQFAQAGCNRDRERKKVEHFQRKQSQKPDPIRLCIAKKPENERWWWCAARVKRFVSHVSRIFPVRRVRYTANNLCGLQLPAFEEKKNVLTFFLLSSANSPPSANSNWNGFNVK